MAYPSVTYTFSNGAAADAGQVNTNFSDLVSGLSDGTKDLSINAITCAGAAVLNGSVTLGNATSDDITFTGSIASSIPVKTTFSYDLGSSTIGWKSFYLGSNDSAAYTVRLIAGAMGASYTMTLPTSGGTEGYVARTDGSGTMSWQHPDPKHLANVGLTASVGSSALTVALKGSNGSDPSSTNPVDIAFRHATATTGTPVLRKVTGALSVVVSSGSTLGHSSATASFVYVYAIDNAGTVELAVSTKMFDDGSIVSTTAEGGAGGADSSTVMYSTTARSNVACRLIGRLTSTQATAGTWATAISEISLQVANIPDGSVGPHKLAYPNWAISDSSNGYSSNATTGVVSNLSVTISTNGRPVRVGLCPDGGSSGASIDLERTTTGTSTGSLAILKSGSSVFRSNIGVNLSGASITAYTMMPSAFNTIISAATGTHTFTVEVYNTYTSSQTVYVTYVKLYAIEE